MLINSMLSIPTIKGNYQDSSASVCRVFSLFSDYQMHSILTEVKNRQNLFARQILSTTNTTITRILSKTAPFFDGLEILLSGRLSLG